MIPGTTPERSAKALKRVRAYVPQEEEEEDLWDSHPVVRQTATGEVKEFFPVKALAQAWDNRTIDSIYKLEREGIIPKARYRAAKGKRRDRLYSREQVEAIVRIAKELGVYSTRTRTKITKTGFTQRLLEVW